MPQVYVSSVIAVPAEQIWARIRNFNALPDWHPGFADSRIEAGALADQVGCVRALRSIDGDMIRERLLALSDYDYSFTYSALECPLDVDNFIATLKLTPITDGDRSFAEWSASFDCAEENEAGLIEMVGQGLFQSGFDALKTGYGH